MDKCYVGVLEVYENPRTLTMLDLMEVSLTTKSLSTKSWLQVNTFKLIDCNLAHHDQEIVQ